MTMQKLTISTVQKISNGKRKVKARLTINIKILKARIHSNNFFNMIIFFEFTRKNKLVINFHYKVY